MALSEGKMFHSIYYGKGILGSHSSQVSKAEIWKIILHIQKLQHPNGVEAPAPLAVDSTGAVAKVPAHK